MMTRLFIYETPEKVSIIDTFKDETIQVTSSVQNINDISKVFTDYSQSFTIPASDNNNNIFKHWYEGFIANGFDQRVRYNGYIEVDNEVFRVGRWQIEGAEIINNQPKNYKITFYGILRSLKDKFKEDKLRDIAELQSLGFTYNGNNVRDRIRNINDVIFPLISSKRVWQYGGGGANDISQNGHAINITELFPAVRVASILDAMEQKYGITFSGQLLSRPQFRNLFMWFKNNDVFTNVTPFQNATISLANNDANSRLRFTNFSSGFTNLGLGAISGVGTSLWIRLFFNIVLPSGATAIVRLIKNGAVFAEAFFEGSTNDYLIFDQNNINQNASYIGDYIVSVQTSMPGTVTFSFNSITTISPIGSTSTSTATGIASTPTALRIPELAPDMKVADFFSGILKLFNLTLVSFDEVNYQLEQLEDWYLNGQIKDFTDYTVTELDVERVKVFKSINFKYQRGESFVNRNFFDNYSREYGNADEFFENEGSDFTLDLPFEKIQFTRIGNDNLNVGFSLQAPDFRPYVPKPILFYAWKNVSTPKFYVKGSVATAMNDYLVCGDFTENNFEFYSNNFNQEQNLQTGGQLSRSLFTEYYANYIENLYKIGSRLVKCKAILPSIELNRLRLNDRIIIRDVRYIINQFTTNLNTGVVEFELLKDFRQVNPTILQTVEVPADDNTIVIPVLDGDFNWVVVVNPDGDVGIVTLPTPSYPFLEVLVRENATGIERYGLVQSDLGSQLHIFQAP